MEVDNTLHLSIAMRKPRRQLCLPARYSDNTPQGPTSLSSLQIQTNAILGSGSTLHTDPSIRKTLTTPCNIFGIYRQYFSTNYPTHDPEEDVTPVDLSDIILTTETTGSLAPSYGPYPNKSAFLLGEWYWNNGVQKSKEGFKHLISIIGSSDFHSADVGNMSWEKVNCALGSSSQTHHELDWMDELDAGWTSTPVSISVPFHRNLPEPGVQEYQVADFYHRSIIDIIQERLTNNCSKFHMEPYELYWKGSFQDQKPIRIQGELYTSPAFITENNTLQSSAAEPNCTLPRVVIGLMFSSDATHLTSFGEAKLWPLYLNFGNDSKYHRCKPSNHLCHHVAYFQKVIKHGQQAGFIF